MATSISRARRQGARLISYIGLGIAASVLLVNPLTLKWRRGLDAVNYGDVVWSYIFWAIVLGTIGYGLSQKIRRGKSWADGASLLYVLGAGIIMLDRLLLVYIGLTLWKHDPELNYVQRPGAVRNLAIADRKEDLIVINEWGHHDTEFPEKKPDGELRGLMLGDSVTMGYGVTYPETFSARLEARLAATDDKYATHNMINTGVHGYSTYQELVVLERSLRFEPDFIVVGFCMNDVTEPFVADADYGGVGLDYHGVTQTQSALVGWLVNDTGFGRLTQRWAQRGKQLEREKRHEIFSVVEMSRVARDDPKYGEAWDVVLEYMGRIYDAAEREKLPVVLAVFPFVHQLHDESARGPNRILAEHAAKYGVEVVDLTEPFKHAIYDGTDSLDEMMAAGASSEEIVEAHKDRILEYFFDADHFTAKGNEIVAEHLHQWLVEKQMVSPPSG